MIVIILTKLAFNINTQRVYKYTIEKKKPKMQ